MSMLLVPRSTILVSDAGAPLEVEAQRQIVDVAEHLAGEPPRGVLPDLLEQGVAQIVRQHAGEARGGVAGDQRRRRRRTARVRRHAVDHRFVGERHQQHRRLAGEHQHHRGDDAQPSARPRPSATASAGSATARRSRRSACCCSCAAAAAIALGRSAARRGQTMRAKRLEPLEFRGYEPADLAGRHMGPGLFRHRHPGLRRRRHRLHAGRDAADALRERGACSAATAAALEANTDFDFPTLVARCRRSRSRRGAPTVPAALAAADARNRRRAAGFSDESDPPSPRSRAAARQGRQGQGPPRRPPASSSAKAWASRPRSKPRAMSDVMEPMIHEDRSARATRASSSPSPIGSRAIQGPDASRTRSR